MHVCAYVSVYTYEHLVGRTEEEGADRFLAYPPKCQTLPRGNARAQRRKQTRSLLPPQTGSPLGQSPGGSPHTVSGLMCIWSTCETNEEMKGRLLCYEAPSAHVLGSYNDSVIAMTHFTRKELHSERGMLSGPPRWRQGWGWEKERVAQAPEQPADPLLSPSPLLC